MKIIIPIPTRRSAHSQWCRLPRGYRTPPRRRFFQVVLASGPRLCCCPSSSSHVCSWVCQILWTFCNQATDSVGYEQQAIDVGRQTIFLIRTSFYSGLYHAISRNLFGIAYATSKMQLVPCLIKSPLPSLENKSINELQTSVKYPDPTTQWVSTCPRGQLSYY